MKLKRKDLPYSETTWDENIKEKKNHWIYLRFTIYDLDK